MRILPAACFILSIVLFNCSDEYDSGKKSHTKGKAKLNISDAVGLYNFEASTGGRVTSYKNKLFKITSSGEQELVQFVNADGTPLDTSYMQSVIDVSGIIKLNSNFVILSGYFQVNDTLGNVKTYSDLLVRTKDGAIYDFQGALPNSDDQPVCQEDGNGNIYYVSMAKVFKLSVANPDNITLESYLPSEHSVSKFAIDRDGNCLYEYGGIKIRKAAGGLYGDISGRHGTYWCTPDNQLVLLDWMDNRIFQYKIVNNEVKDTLLFDPFTYGVEHFGYEGAQEYYQQVNHVKTSSIIQDDNTIYLVGGYQWGKISVENYVIHSIVPNVRMKILGQTATHIFGYDNYNFYKADKETFKCHVIDLPGADMYELYKAKFFPDGQIFFNAMRYSDAKKIVAKIDVNESVSIIDEVTDRKVLVLEPIN